jgi:hypothetical protein
MTASAMDGDDFSSPGSVHVPRLGRAGTGLFSLVTHTLTRRDPLYSCDAAVKALKEIQRLWDSDTFVKIPLARRKGQTIKCAVFSRLFEIHKSRVVVEGSCALDAEGEAAFFSDRSLALTSLPAMRATIAHGESSGCRATHSDATQA